MALIVTFDEPADPQKVIGVLHAPEHDYEGRTDFVVNPDLTALEGVVPQRYWKHDTGLIVEYTQAEKDAQDAAEEAQEIDEVRTDAETAVDPFDGLGVQLRALIQTFNTRDSYLTNRVMELQEKVDAAETSTGNTASLRAAMAATGPFSATATRSKPEAVQAYKDDITSGGADT